MAENGRITISAQLLDEVKRFVEERYKPEIVKAGFGSFDGMLTGAARK